MTEKRLRGPRCGLMLLVATALCLASAPQLAADGGRQGVRSQNHDYRQAGFRIGFGIHGHHRYHHGYHRYGNYRYRGHYYAPYGYYRHYYPYTHTYGDYGTPRYRSQFYGGLDLNVKPKKTTQVYIDGNYVGTAGNFDGWPQHLWLEKDNYEVIFYNPGFKTIVRQVEVHPRVVLDLSEIMEPGESIPVEELSRAPEKPRNSKPLFRRHIPKKAPMAKPPSTPPAPPRAPATVPPSDLPPSAAPHPGALDARQQPARLQLSVEPGDASVYLDGRFLGLAREINARPGGILIDPGEHVIEIVRPGFSNRKQSFSVDPGQDLALKLRLEPVATKAVNSA